MGRAARRRPQFLGKKLKELREHLNLSQGELVERFGLPDYIGRAEISDFENDVREPDLLILYAYARGAGISTDDLIDDKTKLSDKLLGAKPINTTTVLLQLSIESDERAPREEDQARGNIEKAHLKRYGMRKSKDRDDEYELVFSHKGEADLDEQVYALIGAITIEARKSKCSLKVNAREKVEYRRW